MVSLNKHLNDVSVIPKKEEFFEIIFHVLLIKHIKGALSDVRVDQKGIKALPHLQRTNFLTQPHHLRASEGSKVEGFIGGQKGVGGLPGENLVHTGNLKGHTDGVEHGAIIAAPNIGSQPDLNPAIDDFPDPEQPRSEGKVRIGAMGDACPAALEEVDLTGGEEDPMGHDCSLLEAAVLVVNVRVVFVPWEEFHCEVYLVHVLTDVGLDRNLVF